MIVLAALLAAATPTAPLPPTLPWSGGSETLVAKSGDPWITPAEASGFDTTPSYAETMAWLARLDAASPLIRLETFGRSPEGRDLVAVIASRAGAGDPRRPVLLVQAGIHAGEIDGKDAGMMLLRDIALGGKAALLDGVDLVFVPIFNIDGHERSSATSRPNQRGPARQGWRTTAQNLNLNRDYMKADAPEMRAMIGLIRRHDPALYLDIHVTDGIDYQYDVTFGFNGWDGRYARSPAIGRWLDGAYRPALTAALERAGHIPGGLVFAIDDRNPDAGLGDGYFTPRFSNGYGDARRMATVLVENHSLKPYRQRVLGTYVLIEESLRILAAEGEALAAATAADRAARPPSIVASYASDPNPIYERDFRGIAWRHYRSRASGGEEVEWLGTPKDVRLKVFGEKPAARVAPPAAWWVPARETALIDLLRLHGVEMEVLEAPRTIEVGMARLVEPSLGAASEGRVPLRFAGLERLRRSETFAPGSVRVPADQPLGELAALLLEPESPDSALASGFFPSILQRTEYIEGYAIAPLAERMLDADPALKAAFEAQLAADPEFAANPDRRLAWFYARSPYFDDRYLLHPVARED